MICLRKLPPEEKSWALPRLLKLVEQERPHCPHLNLQEASFYARFFDGDGLIAAAWRGSEMVGFSLLGLEPFLSPLWTPYLERMGLRPERCGVAIHLLIDHRLRGLGLGKRLARCRSEMARGRGIETLFATVHPDNHGSLRVLHASGLRAIETRCVYDAQVLRVLMCGPVTAPSSDEGSTVCHLPTPIEPLPRLSRALGGPEIFIKRDDQTGLATGGNKARMLRLFLRDALAKGARTLVTRGSPVSNHCRQTAAAAARAGLACELVIRGHRPRRLEGNLYLAELMGARLTWTEGQDADRALQSVLDRLEREEQAPYSICYGGAHALGALAYAEAVQELMEQRPRPFDHLVVATSSGATQAGLIAGSLLHQYPTRVLGVSVDEPAAKARVNILRLVSEVAKLYGDPPLPEPQVQVCDRHIGPGYAVVSDLERRAISLLAREEGILLDPVYTGRAFGGLMSAIERGELVSGERVLFWHTGGLPSLFQLSQVVTDDA